MPPLYIFLIYSSDTFRSSLCNSQSPNVWVLLSSVLPQTQLCAHSSSTIRPLVHLFFAGPGPLYENAVSGFLHNPLGRANKFSSLSLDTSKCSSLFTYFSASLFLTSVLYSSTLSMDSVPSWLPPRSFNNYSTKLSLLIPACPFVTFSYTVLSPSAGNVFNGMFLTFRMPFCHCRVSTSWASQDRVITGDRPRTAHYPNRHEKLARR